MAWLQVQIELGRLAPEPVEAALLQLGALALEYRDAGGEAIFEPAPGATPLWRELVVSALLAADTDPQRVQLAVAAAVAPAALPAMRFAAVADQDWVRSFRASLRPLRFGSGLWIVPPGIDPPRGARAVVRLEPGLAFGSGSHATTALCLEWLASLRCDGTVLDFGCGSGVLALAALALGASGAVALDVDPQARAASLDNATRNAVGDRLRVVAPAELDASEEFDAVVANILSGPLMALAPTLCAHLRPGAAIALSGILDEQAAAVGASFARWIDFDPPARRGDWVRLSGRSRGRI